MHDILTDFINDFFLRSTSANKCSKCGRVFYTLEDEYAENCCPHCGYFPHKTVRCAGCGKAIELSEEVYVVKGDIIIHADWDCLYEVLEIQTMALEEALRW